MNSEEGRVARRQQFETRQGMLTVTSVAAQDSTSVIGRYPEAQQVALDISELSTTGNCAG